MNKNDKLIRKLAKTLLFENNISERYMPDDMHYSNPKSVGNHETMFDRPGPQMDGDQNYEKLEDIEVPITADDVMPNSQLSVIKTDSSSLEDKNYSPLNKKELEISMQTLINDKDLNDDQIKSIWQAAKKIISQG